MSFLLRVSGTIDAVNAWVGKTVSWCILISVLVSAGNATMRKAFDVSSNAWLELQWYLFSAVFLLAAGYTLLRREHVRIDLFWNMFPRRLQLWIEVLGTIFFLMPLALVTIWLSWPIVVDKFVHGEMSGNAGGLVLWPVWVLIPIGFVLLALQGVSELIKRSAVLAGAIEDDEAADQAMPYASAATVREE